MYGGVGFGGVDFGGKSTSRKSEIKSPMPMLGKSGSDEGDQLETEE